jgi:hypothetical protein
LANAREAIAGDTQLARRLDQLALPRWKADEEFQTLVVAILRSLPLRRPSALFAHSLRTLTHVTDGITAKVFSIAQRTRYRSGPLWEPSSIQIALRANAPKTA